MRRMLALLLVSLTGCSLYTLKHVDPTDHSDAKWTQVPPSNQAQPAKATK